MSEQQADLIGHGAPEPGDTPDADKPPVSPAAARRIARLAGSKGGKRPKSSVAVTGLGASAPPAITAESLSTLAGRLEVLRAVVEALALGRCSSATATAITQAVRAAAEDARQDQGEVVEALLRRVEELTQGRVIR
jgi:hypothetical protein